MGIEDEADNIDEDGEKMAIYKNGNVTGRPVARTDTSSGRKQFKLNTFCWKAFAAERLPQPSKKADEGEPSEFPKQKIEEALEGMQKGNRLGIITIKHILFFPG